MLFDLDELRLVCFTLIGANNILLGVLSRLEGTSGVFDLLEDSAFTPTSICYSYSALDYTGG